MKIQIMPSERGSGFRGVVFPLVIRMMLFLLLLLPCGPAAAEDLLDIYNLARESDPTFQREFYRHEASPEVLNQAYSELMPTVSGDALYKRSNQEIMSTDIAVYQSTTSRYPSKGYTLSLVQPILNMSSIYRVMQAKEEVKRADLQFEAAKQDLLLKVAEAYSVVLESSDNLTFTRAEEAAIQRHFELAQGRYRSGLAPVTDFHDAKARLADTKAQKVKAQNRLEDSLEALTELTGKRIENVAKLKTAPVPAGMALQEGRLSDRASDRSGKSPAAPSSLARVSDDKASERERKAVVVSMPLVSPDPDNLESWMEAASKNSLEVEAQRQAVEVAEREIERQKAGHAPVLSVVGRINRDDEGGSLFGGESDVMTKEAYVQLTVPIFQGLSVVSKTREAIKLHAAARAELEKEVRGANRAAKASFLGVKSAIENVEAFKQSVLSNQMALEAKREGFKSGLFPALAVLDAERDLHRAKQNYARAHYEYIVYSLRLKKAVGILSEEDLVAINQWLD